MRILSGLHDIISAEPTSILFLPLLPFLEILLVIWGIFFIAIRSGEPELKGRNLVKTVKTGAQNVVRGATSIASRVSAKRGAGEPTPSEGKETLPAWDVPSVTTSDVSM